jgi:hypothetical protein
MPSVCRPVAASALTTGTGLRFIGGLARNHDHQEERNEALAAGKRRVVVASAVVLGAAVIAAGASADFRSVDDPKGDVKCRRGCSDSAKRNADIVKAKASHDVGQLRHTIRVVGKVKQVGLTINTDSDPGCERQIFLDRGNENPEVRKCGSPRIRTGVAHVEFDLDSVRIFFSERSIGNPRGYGWRASAGVGERGGPRDDVPNRDGYIRHRLG